MTVAKMMLLHPALQSIKSVHSDTIYKQTPTPSETPTLIQEKLANFESDLDTIDKEKKRGYIMAKEKCPSECDDTFKLVFLRCEVFNVERAVDRFVKYWNTRIEVFGEKRAFLPMSLDGAMKDDTVALQMDYLQVATETDPAGRAILLFDFNKEAGEVSSESLLRVVWYQVHVALTLESCQKRGVVCYVRCLDRMSDWRPSLSKKIATAGRGILPIRFAGMHFMHPPTSLSIIMACIKPLVGKKLRHRFYTHSGSTGDILKSLSRFGLGTKDKLPVNFGGHLVFV